MSKNINFDDNADDTEGHVRAMGETPSFRISEEAPGAVDEDENDTEGHVMRFGEAPSMRACGEAPGISGALSVDPKTTG
jgi:hypothetical protein